MSNPTMFRPVDFRPAPPGWRLVYINSDGSVFIVVMPGWLVEEEVEYDPVTFDDSTPTGARRIAAGALDEGEVRAADGSSNFWFVLPPGEMPPTDEQAAAEVERRRKERASLRAIAQDARGA